jgi:uncharacterized protein
VKYIFADTGYWVALLNPGDNLHSKAASLSRSLQPCHIVTTEMVLVEVLNDFSKRGDYMRDAAAKFIQNLYQHPNTTIIEQTSVQFKEALALYIQRKDKAWSQTDCVSFNLMQEYSLVEALAYDKHFVQAGFQPLMRNCQTQNRLA